MSFDTTVIKAKKYFPDLQIKYKNKSLLMKILGLLLFFNKDFMTSYATTINSSIHFPNETFIKLRPLSSIVVLLHELVHMYDAKKITSLFFNFLYMFPQILILFCLPLFIISWKIALPLLILFALPLPAYFRMYFEKRAYISSLYVIYQLSKKMNFDPKLHIHSEYFLNQFKGPYYYYMWIFKDIDKSFINYIEKINLGERPYEDPIFDILDDLIKEA